MKKLLILIMLVTIMSCVKTEDEYIIAQVNQAKLTMDEFKANFTEKEWDELTAETKESYIQDWIQLNLLAQEADLLGISKTPKVIEKIKTAELNIKANLLLAHKLSEITAREDELFNYYKIHRNEYTTSFKEYKVQRIFTTDEAKLNEILEAIKATSFKDAAISYSEESAGENGGYIGFVSQQNTHENIWNALTSLKKYYYKSVKTEKGFYIVRFYDVRTVTNTDNYIDVKEEIRQAVIKMKKERLFDELISDLKNKSEIKISL
ncbi:MAG: peptidylprolyl isomerase [Candidatus Cloacimonetes bacterium]|nr:peptidylprolyl isomerase [Candidatus Cloacimonadota bacterium]